MRRATVVLDEIDATARELSVLPGPGGTVHLGRVPSAGATLVPEALAALRRGDPGLQVISREGATPALARALRAGSTDLALPASAPPFRAPDDASPPLALQTLAERSLCLAVTAEHPLTRRDFVDVADLRGQLDRRASSRYAAGRRSCGAFPWPGCPSRRPNPSSASRQPCGSRPSARNPLRVPDTRPQGRPGTAEPLGLAAGKPERHRHRCGTGSGAPDKVRPRIPRARASTPAFSL